MRILAKIRRKQNLHAKKLAELVGISPTQLSLTEHGRYNPRPEVLMKLARILKTDAAELLMDWDELEDLNAIERN